MPPIAIGIDLGTTYSCVAAFRDGNVDIITTINGKRTIPSMVSFAEHERLIGEEAKVQAGTNSQNTVYDTKRLIGRKIHDKVIQEDIRQWPFEVTGDHNGNPVINVRHRGKHEQFRPEEISAMILERLKKMVEDYTGECVQDVVITVPAYFNNAQRQATKRASNIAELNVIRLLNEPTAAAIAYGFENRRKDATTILIVDLGGGTFDVTILMIEDNIYDVKATNGDTHLGGEDFDYRLVAHCVGDIGDRFGMDISYDKKAMHRLKMECEKAKAALSTARQNSIDISSLFNDTDYHITITRQKFEELNQDLFLKILGPIDEALQQADMSAANIDEIVLVGGSTRIPKIEEILTKKFPRSSINKDINPDEAVAHGAAIQAAKLAGDEECEALQEMTLLDVTPLSLGIETAGGLMSVVIPRNTAVPVTKTKIFSTHKDGQTAVRVKVFEGERSLTKENNLLGDFRLTGIRPSKSVKIEVAFNVDSDGILNVTAKEQGERNENVLGLTNHVGGPTKEEIEAMIQKAKDLRQEDDKEKERVQAKVYLESLCLRYQSELRDSQSNGRVSAHDKQTALTAVAEMLSWLDIHSGNSKEDYEKRRQHLRGICEPILQKIRI